MSSRQELVPGQALKKQQQQQQPPQQNLIVNTLCLKFPSKIYMLTSEEIATQQKDDEQFILFKTFFLPIRRMVLA